MSHYPWIVAFFIKISKERWNFMGKIEGKIRNVIFNSESGFLVAVFRVKKAHDELLKELEGKSITITGMMAEQNTEDTYVLEGSYIRHERYGMQFSFQTYEKKLPEGKDGVIDFLASPLIKGCGIKTAEQIVATLGEDALKLIKENKENLFLVPGMTPKKCEAIYISVLSYSEVDDTIIKLKNLGFSMNEATKLIKHYQDKTMIFVEQNLYLFKEFIPFNKLDAIYLKIHEADDALRIKECLKEAMERQSRESGDAYYYLDEVKEKVKKEFQILLDDDTLEKYLDELVNSKDIIIEEDNIYLKKYYDMECDIAHILKRMSTYPKKSIKGLKEKLGYLEDVLEVKYNKDQETAIMTALQNPVSIISGGPGTGKTTIVNAITRLFIEVYKLSPLEVSSQIALLAPTGRAAKKLSTSTHLPASTIHRYLKWNKDTNDFQINEYNKNYQKLIIVDETSMIDEYLFVSLLKGIPESSQIVFVGDTFQLPSVGAGLILNDLVTSQLFPYTSLDMIYRQSENSYIPILAKEIKEKKLSESFLEKKDDYNFLPCEAKNLKEMIKQIILRSQSKGLKVEDVQILAPMYKGENGIDNLNVLLQELFNPHDETKKELKYFDVVYREKDKVLQLINNPDCNVYNGDIGYIDSIKEIDNPYKHTEVTIDFDGNKVVYKTEDLQSIKHAYAMTIHKSQGSEFPHVILPVTKNYYKMLYNKLIYTGVSRAKKSLVIIGEKEAFMMSVYNDYATNRKTGLKEKLMYNFKV